jgi:hypothetical protein
MGICDKWVSDPKAKCIYFAVLIVLIFLVVFYLKKVAGPERFQSGYSLPTEWQASISGSGLGEAQGVARSQASGRRQAFSGQFSQPGQGLRNTQYNADVVATGQALGVAAPTTISAGHGVDRSISAAATNTGGSMERLVNYRYAPQFDETWSEELAKYQAMVPPVVYQVIDEATRGYTSGNSSGASAVAEHFLAGELPGTRPGIDSL